ncbi:unnamed protein product, partial [Effrenium voratum]
DEAWYKEHCLRHLLGDNCVPIFVHGDDAESHRRRSFCVVSWGSCLTHGSPYDTRFVIYAGDNNRCFDASYQALDAWVVWHPGTLHHRCSTRIMALLRRIGKLVGLQLLPLRAEALIELTATNVPLRAAVFVNLDAMRQAVSLKQNPTGLLAPKNREALQQANYLFHCAFNSLAQEAIREERLLWKIRPKHHKRLNSKYLRGFLCLSA